MAPGITPSSTTTTPVSPLMFPSLTTLFVILTCPQACSNTGGPENCQTNIVSLEGSLHNVNIYCLSTVGTTDMVVQNGKALAIYSDNVDVYPDTIALFQAATTTITTGIWPFLGCYTDSIQARTLSHYVTVPGGQGAMTIEACQATCQALGYIFAGVEFAQECCKPTLYSSYAITLPLNLNFFCNISGKF